MKNVKSQILTFFHPIAITKINLKVEKNMI